ncbi:hypothetical protein [Micromonospora sp. DT233]|uniref:hypothetical protein n=1 Tax=Micromonospora sp. DT233 TaxID=3393432 RepID=UPI003CE6C20F
MTTRRLSWLILDAVRALDWHKHRQCAACHPSGWCPLVELARARIRAWRRYGPRR